MRPSLSYALAKHAPSKLTHMQTLTRGTSRGDKMSMSMHGLWLWPNMPACLQADHPLKPNPCGCRCNYLHHAPTCCRAGHTLRMQCWQALSALGSSCTWAAPSAVHGQGVINIQLASVLLLLLSRHLPGLVDAVSRQLGQLRQPGAQIVPLQIVVLPPKFPSHAGHHRLSSEESTCASFTMCMDAVSQFATIISLELLTQDGRNARWCHAGPSRQQCERSDSPRQAAVNCGACMLRFLGHMSSHNARFCTWVCLRPQCAELA